MPTSVFLAAHVAACASSHALIRVRPSGLAITPLQAPPASVPVPLCLRPGQQGGCVWIDDDECLTAGSLGMATSTGFVSSLFLMWLVVLRTSESQRTMRWRAQTLGGVVTAGEACESARSICVTLHNAGRASFLCLDGTRSCWTGFSPMTDVGDVRTLAGNDAQVRQCVELPGGAMSVPQLPSGLALFPPAAQGSPACVPSLNVRPADWGCAGWRW
jgi:hypothetical protein